MAHAMTVPMGASPPSKKMAHGTALSRAARTDHVALLRHDQANNWAAGGTGGAFGHVREEAASARVAEAAAAAPPPLRHVRQGHHLYNSQWQAGPGAGGTQPSQPPLQSPEESLPPPPPPPLPPHEYGMTGTGSAGKRLAFPFATPADATADGGGADGADGGGRGGVGWQG